MFSRLPASKQAGSFSWLLWASCLLLSATTATGALSATGPASSSGDVVMGAFAAGPPTDTLGSFSGMAMALPSIASSRSSVSLLSPEAPQPIEQLFANFSHALGRPPLPSDPAVGGRPPLLAYAADQTELDEKSVLRLLHAQVTAASGLHRLEPEDRVGFANLLSVSLATPVDDPVHGNGSDLLYELLYTKATQNPAKIFADVLAAQDLVPFSEANNPSGREHALWERAQREELGRLFPGELAWYVAQTTWLDQLLNDEEQMLGKSVPPEAARIQITPSVPFAASRPSFFGDFLSRDSDSTVFAAELPSLLAANAGKWSGLIREPGFDEVQHEAKLRGDRDYQRAVLYATDRFSATEDHADPDPYDPHSTSKKRRVSGADGVLLSPAAVAELQLAQKISHIGEVRQVLTHLLPDGQYNATYVDGTLFQNVIATTLAALEDDFRSNRSASGAGAPGASEQRNRPWIRPNALAIYYLYANRLVQVVEGLQPRVDHLVAQAQGIFISFLILLGCASWKAVT